MNGTWTSEASGIQWAFEGTGRVGLAGIPPPTSGKIQIASIVEATSRREALGDVNVVERVRVGGVGEAGQQHEPHDERERIEGERRPHGGAR